ncbi:MAG: SMC-Scp complex subunit ScpB [Proteobacteria bacterium]|nr:SMC-Scp complex subunit ScpB [Pseudomonadota bacterium]MCH9758499.1 SMC-Scp complex subunit ScpB [Pseudomonadota bacterium]
MNQPPVNTDNNQKNIIELALLTAGQPLDIRALKRILDDNTDSSVIKTIVQELQQDWEPRALQLIETASGFQFTSRPEYIEYIRRLNPQRPQRLSRSLLEVLAVIAYRQPVTRGDIEQIRGIAVSSNHIAFLEEQCWIEEVGRRETPGRPVLYATSNTFLDDLGLTSLNDLPQLLDTEDDSMEEDITSPDTNNKADTHNERQI